MGVGSSRISLSIPNQGGSDYLARKVYSRPSFLCLVSGGAAIVRSEKSIQGLYQFLNRSGGIVFLLCHDLLAIMLVLYVMKRKADARDRN